jgi:oxygen-dependent protoporphyrinogen oxidase
VIYDVLIAGGGISGLTAARDLVRAGRRVRLVEARARLGGVIQTEQIDGFTIEAGPDSLLMTKPSAAALCDELGLTLVPTLTPRTAYILRDGELHAIPPGSVLGLPSTPDAIAQASMLSPAGRARLLEDFSNPRPAETSDVDVSIGALIRRRFGDEAVRYLAQPLLGGIHAGDVEQLSMQALFPRIAALDREPGSLLDGDGGGAIDSDGMFRSIPGGLGTLISAIARSLPPEDVALNTSIEHLDLPDVTLSSGETIQTRAVLLALPAYTIATLLEPFDTPLARLCRTIPYSSSATITLCYRADAVTRPLSGTGFVVPRGESQTRLLAASFVTSKWANRAPDNTIMLRAFAGGTLDADLLDRDDDELIALAHHDLAPLLGITEGPRFSRVYRWLRAGPQYELGHLTRVRAIEQRLAWHAGVFVTGSAFRGIGIPDTVADARTVADQVGRWLDADSAGKMAGA